MAQDLYFIDLTPEANVLEEEDDSLKNSEDKKIEDQQENHDSNLQPALLLPSHVSVLGSLPVQNIPTPPLPSDASDDYIEFLDYGGPSNVRYPQRQRLLNVEDYDQDTGLVRYFETQEEKDQSNTPTVIVCKRCGAKGDHKASNCPVIIECPTVWRLYEYVTESDRNQTLKTRRSKKKLLLGQGGEGYIAEDLWCYNCGGSGHWGDDCKAIPHNGDVPAEGSAFGSNNLFSGPFADFTADQPSTTRPEPQEWEKEEYWGDRVPTNVGKKGRKKEMATLKAQQRDEDESGDWFEPLPSLRRPNPPEKQTKMKFNIKPGTSLLDRLSDAPVSASHHGNDRGTKRPNDYDSYRDRDKKRDRDMDRNFGRSKEKEEYRAQDRRSKDRRRESDGRPRDKTDRRDSRGADYSKRNENGPRYRGGYNR
ncbi:hypothetical protein VNI00_005567 [Paramarasmius palmivorus]|uniref:CCHC-type domain-containing protein n=1 Tax=Paramarasmius palmivorus TaxID=297713 RepID=A0AAW0DG77_9AGAR